MTRRFSDRYDNKARAALGKNSLGRAPYGYAWGDGGVLVKDENARVVAEIFSLDGDCFSPSDIADMLNSVGWVGPGRKSWSHTAVRRILNKRAFYEGRGNVVKDGIYLTEKPAHLPILDCEPEAKTLRK